MNYEALMEPFDFTLDDLIQNRHHLISPRQANKLKRMRLEAMVLPVFVMLLAGGFAVTSLPREPRQLLTFLVTSAVFMFSVYGGTTRWIRVSTDLRKGKVSIIHGKVSIGGATRNVGYQGEGRRLTINNLVFIIPFEASSALSKDVRYLLYFLPASKIVLAVEKDRN